MYTPVYIWTMLVAALLLTQREALTAIYLGNGGANWVSHENWNTDAPICTWEGVACNRDGYIIKIELSGYGLTGQLDDVFSAFQFLKILNLSNNSLVSTFPSSLCRLRNLQYFFINGAGFIGELPQCICSMEFVQYFVASNNSFTGSIPTCVDQMKFLRGMNLGCNDLRGNVPVQFSELYAFNELAVQCNPNLACTGFLTEYEKFVYKCGIEGFNCDACLSPVNQCPAFIPIDGCGIYALKTDLAE